MKKNQISQQIQITAITGGLNEPSSRFRVRQYIKPLKQHGINVREYIPFIPKSARFWYSNRPIVIQAIPQITMAGLRVISRIPAIIGSYHADLTWIQREFLTPIKTTEGLTKRPRVFDVDDAIWLRLNITSGFAKRIVRGMDALVCGNSWIADYFSDCNVPTWVIPTAVDTAYWNPGEKKKSEGCFYLGWIGTSANYRYLSEIEPALSVILQRHHNIKLLVVSDAPPSLNDLPTERVEYIPWSKDIEVSAVKKMDVGLMPLRDSDWERGKCAYKMLTYMATEIPVIVSPVGMNADVLNMGEIGFGPQSIDEWVDTIDAIYLNQELGARMGSNGLQIVREHFSIESILPQLMSVFYKTTGND